MAHFAKLSEENKVLQVVTIEDSKILDSNQNESESVGQAYLEENNNWPANMWKKTSYGTLYNQHYTVSDGIRTLSADQTKAFRGNYAGIGYTYDASLDQFVPPKPLNGWVYSSSEAKWNPPTPMPESTNGEAYSWDDENEVWVQTA